MRLTHMRLLPYPRSKSPADPDPGLAPGGPAPGPIPVAEDPPAPAPPSLGSVVRRTLAPAATHAGTVQTRGFHTVYALATLPLVIALHAALWALSTPGRLGATLLVLYGLGRTGILTAHATH
ncbi:hypothetical protein [Embleya scabrispora]|uniref:hypothetical protein n=1 Tax=Embleya scabrispora TaxID=159449 RepID=UPI000374C338|nr:hypothetical protein [Embleya scabrispora]MYS83108.1 hypothetical protein [Streptomyces sp. SID5474]